MKPRKTEIIRFMKDELGAREVCTELIRRDGTLAGKYHPVDLEWRAFPLPEEVAAYNSQKGRLYDGPTI